MASSSSSSLPRRRRPPPSSPLLLLLSALWASSSVGPSAAAAEPPASIVGAGAGAGGASEAGGSGGGGKGEGDEDPDPCRLYLAESTIPNAGVGMFAGIPYPAGRILNRDSYGDTAILTFEQDWHSSPARGPSISRHDHGYHWPLTNYDWNSPAVGMDDEGEDCSVTSPGFGAAANSYLGMVNVEEWEAHYDDAGWNRYDSPGAGAFNPWFNRSSTARVDVEAGQELFVDYGSAWFEDREALNLAPIAGTFRKAQAFMTEYGRLLVSSFYADDMTKEKMLLYDEAQRDLWDVIKTFPYATRERQALPRTHDKAARAVRKAIQAVEKESTFRSLDYLAERGKCLDNIVPGPSTIPHAGRGAFATRLIPKGGLVAPAPVVHLADKSHADMYDEATARGKKSVRDERKGVVQRQLVLNYVFGHPESSVVLFPYSSNVAYVNHHATDFNAEVRWARDAAYAHRDAWLSEPVEFLEEQWSAGLMLEFVALRDIQLGEEVLINYGAEWQKAWDKHVENWKPIPRESDYNNLTLWAEKQKTNNGREGCVHAETFYNDKTTPLRTMHEQKENPYPHCVTLLCIVNVNHDDHYLFAPKSTPYFFRGWNREKDNPEEDEEKKYKHYHECQITERYPNEDDAEEEDDHEWRYTVAIVAEKTHLSPGEGPEEPFEEHHRIYNVPRDAFDYQSVHYTSDVFLKNAFRHEMHLPDDVFPKAWRNLAPEKATSTWRSWGS